MGQGNQYQFQGAASAPSTSQTGHISQGQRVGQGRAQELQAESSGQAGQMTCYHYRQPGHMRQDCCFVLIRMPNSIPKRRNYGCLAL